MDGKKLDCATSLEQLKIYLEDNELGLYHRELLDTLGKYRRTFFGYMFNKSRKNPSILEERYFATIWRDISFELESKNFEDAAKKVYAVYAQLKKSIIRSAFENALDALIFGFSSVVLFGGNVILGNKVSNKFENYLDKRDFRNAKRTLDKIALTTPFSPTH